jgi:hypothetical protein
MSYAGQCYAKKTTYDMRNRPTEHQCERYVGHDGKHEYNGGAVKWEDAHPIPSWACPNAFSARRQHG